MRGAELLPIKDLFMRTFRTIGIIGSAAAILLSASMVFAREQATSTSREQVNNDYRAMAASTTARMQAVRADAQNRMAAQREKVAQRVADIQDEAKQQIAKNLAAQFDNLNSTWTDRFMQTLDRYDTILQKMEDRTNIAAGNGKDIASTTIAIQSAKTAVTNARTAVVAQAAKTYTLNPLTIPATATTTTSGQEKLMKGLRTSFQNLHATLFKDLFALRDGPMKDARKAVQNALQELSQISN